MRFLPLALFASLLMSGCSDDNTSADDGILTESATEPLAEAAPAASSTSDSTPTEAPDAIAAAMRPAFENAVDIDILGLKLGMSPEQVYDILKQRGFDVGDEARQPEPTSRRRPSQLIERLSYERLGEGRRPYEEIKMYFTASNRPQVLSIERRTAYRGESATTFSSVLPALTEKYGEPAQSNEEMWDQRYQGHLRHGEYYYPASGTDGNCQDYMRPGATQLKAGDNVYGCRKGLEVTVNQNISQGVLQLNYINYYLRDVGLFRTLARVTGDMAQRSEAERQAELRAQRDQPTETEF